MIELRHRRVCRGFPEDLVRLTRHAVLPLPRLHLVGDIGWSARPLAAVDLCLLAPLIQSACQTANLCGDRHDCLPAGTVLTLVVKHQPRRALADLGKDSFVVLLIVALSDSGVEVSGKPGAVQLLGAYECDADWLRQVLED